jgi:RNA polymerase sigma factor (sigma-70 family)
MATLAADVPVDASVMLLARAQAGDAHALDLLLTRYLPRMKRWVHRRVPAGARGMLDTCDVVQETVIKMVRHLKSIEIRHPRSVQAYLSRAVSNRMIDLYRRAGGAPVADDLHDDMAAPDASPVEALIGAETQRCYECALLQLRPVERRAVIMRVEMGRSYDDIATALNKPTAGAARIAVMRALAKLAREMGTEQTP